MEDLTQEQKYKERELEEKLALINKRIKELGEKKPATRKQNLGQKDGFAWEAELHVYM